MACIGLAPQVFQSGDSCRFGSLPPSGNRWLRYVLVLLANRIARSGKDNRLRQLYWRTLMRHDKNYREDRSGAQDGALAVVCAHA